MELDTMPDNEDSTAAATTHIEREPLVIEKMDHSIDSFMDGGGAFVSVEIDSGPYEIASTFGLEEAEKLLVELRDEIVRAKRKELEWKTDTDPETGIQEGA